MPREMTPFDILQSTHDNTAERFSRLKGARTMLDTVRRALEGLADLGDIVKPEDVVKTAGNLVSEGLGPLPLAKLLADMPEGGQSLQNWINSHLQNIDQREAQLAPVLEATRHAQAVQAMRLLMGYAAKIPGSPSGTFDNQNPLSSPQSAPGPDESAGPANALQGAS